MSAIGWPSEADLAAECERIRDGIEAMTDDELRRAHADSEPLAENAAPAEALARLALTIVIGEESEWRHAGRKPRKNPPAVCRRVGDLVRYAGTTPNYPPGVVAAIGGHMVDVVWTAPAGSRFHCPVEAHNLVGASP